MLRMTRDRSREAAFGLGLLLSVGLGFAALEAGYRAFHASRSEVRVEWRALLKATAERGPGPARFRAGASFGEIRFNSFGFRGPEPEIPQPADLVRIAFLGDSKVLSADLPESRTLAAQTVAALSGLVPGCRFDYLTIAGPRYDFPTLAARWRESATATQPDVAVVLAGTVTRIARPRAAAPEVVTWVDRLALRSDLLRAVKRRIAYAEARLVPRPRHRPDREALSAALRRDVEILAAALGATPTLALGYRSRIRPGLPAERLARYSRELRLAMPGLTPEGAEMLTEINVAALAAAAARAGWRFADPIAEMPDDDRRFADDSHFSELGLAFLADRIAGLLAPKVRAGCRVVRE